MSIPMTRSPDELDARLAQEIAEAKAGTREQVSTLAAAHYLGIHHSTLSKLRTKGLGPKGRIANTRGGKNAKVSYTLAELDAWNKDRTASGYIEQRQKNELADERAELERRALLLELHDLKAENARLQKKLRERGLAFASLFDVTEPMDWLEDERGRILGHVLTAPDSALSEAVVRVSLADVLRNEWEDENSRRLFHDAYVAVLHGEVRDAERAMTANAQKNELARVVRLSRPHDEALPE